MGKKLTKNRLLPRVWGYTDPTDAMTMDAPLSLPLPLQELPEALQRFANPKGPAPARMMAAKGMVPIKGSNLVVLVLQLAADADAAVAAAAGETLDGLPPGVLLPACDGDLHPAMLHGLAERFAQREQVAQRLAANHATSDTTMAELALRSTETVSEIIAINQTRLLGAPLIIEALYKNPNTRMSTAERLIELAARNGVELTGIPSFKHHVEAIRGQLVPEPSKDPLPGDASFTEALTQDDDVEAIEVDEEEGKEEIKEEFVPLTSQIREMNIGEKLRLAFLGSAAARSILVRDPNKIVAMAAITAPTVSESEAKKVATSREVPDEVLRFIAKKKEWIRQYDVKKSLLFNPKTPLGITMNLLPHLRRNDLRMLSKSRGVPPALRQAAKQRQKKIMGGSE